ncbi:hypothetical protein [Nocardia gipuzkoensis]
MTHSAVRGKVLAVAVLSLVVVSMLSACADGEVPRSHVDAGCVDADASNPKLEQAYQGYQASMVATAQKAGSSAAVIAELQAGLAPGTMLTTMPAETVVAQRAVLAAIPVQGCARYVRSYCAAEKQWEQRLDNSRVSWALAWQGMEECRLILDQPVSQRDSYVASLGEQNGDVVARSAHASATAAREFLCPG